MRCMILHPFEHSCRRKSCQHEGEIRGPLCTRATDGRAMCRASLPVQRHVSRAVTMRGVNGLSPPTSPSSRCRSGDAEPLHVGEHGGALDSQAGGVTSASGRCRTGPGARMTARSMICWSCRPLPRPAIVSQGLQRLGGDDVDALVQLPCIAAHEVTHQQGNLLWEAFPTAGQKGRAKHRGKKHLGRRPRGCRKTREPDRATTTKAGPRLLRGSAAGVRRGAGREGFYRQDGASDGGLGRPSGQSAIRIPPELSGSERLCVRGRQSHAAGAAPPRLTYCSWFFAVVRSTARR